MFIHMITYFVVSFVKLSIESKSIENKLLAELMFQCFIVSLIKNVWLVIMISIFDVIRLAAS